MKKIMILGAGIYQVPLIKTAKRQNGSASVLSSSVFQGTTPDSNWRTRSITKTQQIMIKSLRLPEKNRLTVS